jgi:integrase
MAKTVTQNCYPNQCEPMAHPRLVWRNGIAYFRARYPNDIRSLFASEQRWTSLKTKCRCEAMKKIKAVDLAFDAKMDAIRAAHRTGDTIRLKQIRELSTDGLRRLTERYFASLLQVDEQHRKANAEEKRQGYLGFNRDERRENIEAFKASAGVTLADGEVDDTILSELDTILAADGLEFDKTPQAQRSRVNAASKFLEAAYKAFAAIEKREQGEWIPSPEMPATIDHGVTIGELIDGFLSDPSSKRSEDTAHGYKLPFDLLKEVLGEGTPANQVTRQDCERIREILMGLPINARIRYPSIPLGDTVALAKRDGVKTLGPVTINNYLNGLASLFKWGVKTWRVNRNPATGLTIPDPVPDKDKRHPIPIQSLITLFKAPIFTGCKDDGHGYLTPAPEGPRRGRFWVPLLSLHHGIRLTEACQLHVTDLKEYGGVLCLFITEENADEMEDNDRKRVKSEAGQRYVPLHPQIVSFGFPAYVASMKANGHTRIFPEIKRAKDGSFGPFSKWFARLLLKTGVKAKGVTFHSLRHNYRDALDRAGTTRAENLALGGWAKVLESGLDNTSDGYGGGAAKALGARRLAEVMAKIDFRDPDANEGKGLVLDLDYLRPLSSP